MKRISRKTWLAVAVVAAVWLVTAYVCLHWSDPDFGWHYRSGLYILAHGVPQYDIFSYTAAGHRWVNAEWLNDIVMATLAKLGIYWLLAVVYAGLWTLAVSLAARSALTSPMIGFGVAALVPYLGIRSIVWSALGVAIVLWLASRPRRWWWLPLLFVLWANLHAGFALGLVILVVYAVCQRSWRLAGWTAISVVVTLINPYGVRLYGEIWQTMTDTQLHTKIVEWWPLSLTSGNVIFVALAVTVLATVKFDWPRRMVAGLVLLATLEANRQLPFLVLVMAEPIATAYHANVAKVLEARRGLALKAGLIISALSLVTIYSALFWPIGQAAAATYLPYRSVQSLQATPCDGQVFNDYSFGGYIIWQLPGTKVYIDGRMPSWRGPEGRYLDRWQRVLSDPTYARSEFERYNIGCALILNTDTTLIKTLKQAGWRQTVTEPQASLWRKN